LSNSARTRTARLCTGARIASAAAAIVRPAPERSFPRGEPERNASHAVVVRGPAADAHPAHLSGVRHLRALSRSRSVTVYRQRCRDTPSAVLARSPAPPPVGSPARPFSAAADHRAHGRFAPTMPSLQDRRATLAAGDL
jgi:hypothetical protein